jgi:hypothetical protein
MLIALTGPHGNAHGQALQNRYRRGFMELVKSIALLAK